MEFSSVSIGRIRLTGMNESRKEGQCTYLSVAGIITLKHIERYKDVHAYGNKELRR